MTQRSQPGAVVPVRGGAYLTPVMEGIDAVAPGATEIDMPEDRRELVDVAPYISGRSPVPPETEARLAACETPVVAPGRATFLYSGDADAVALVRWIGGVDRIELHPIAQGRIWALEMSVEDGGRFEYKLAVTRDGHEHWILDPRNPHRAGDPFGENSVCMTWGYERPDWTHPAPVAAGRIDPLAVESAVFDETRHERVYVPVGAPPPGGWPVVVVHDGADYDEFASLSTSLDNLIAGGDLPPLLAVMIQTGDRMDEYARGRRHARYVVEELLPAVAARYPATADPAHRVAMGASLGAVASLATAFRYPGVFGGLVLKSGSFILEKEKLETRPHPVFARVARLVGALRRAPGTPARRVFVHTGELEGLADQNRALADHLSDRGMDVRFKSVWDGHHWHNWRDQLRDGLRWALAVDGTA